jgi:hypothetical protein
MLLVPERQRPLDADVVSMIAYIERWDGPKALRDNVVNQLRQRNKITTNSVLTDLKEQSVVLASGVAAWNSIRHKVAHGELIAPWSKEEEDERIKALATIFHALARHLITSQSSTGSANGPAA